ncbi:MAG: hypothetical protein ACYC6C_00280 [Coriobacteriia bacterium]
MGDMVSRDQGPEPPPGTPLELMFATWRVMLTRALSSALRLGGRAGDRIASRLSSIRDTVACARSGSGSARARLLIAAAITAVTAGTALNAVFVPSGSGVRAFATALVAALWVAARFPAMRIAATRATDHGARAVPRAWATGALLHVAAVTPELRFIAWAAGMALSWRVLRADGHSSRDAWVISGAGYGLEAAGFVLLVLFRSFRVALLLVGGA